jgi:NaMN:DMB phosphoribosyltransferase
MLAVAALIAAIDGSAALDAIAIGTTRWFVTDPAADVVGLAADISPDLPVLAANLDFSASRHLGLRAYETFLVKEGVGAGGACVAALLASGASIETLEAAIDAAYDEVIPGSLTLDAR